MSGGYTPLFGTLTTGTLCGRWPDIGLWPVILSMSDRHGIVDVTPAYIAGVTGLPVADVIACMHRFCEPDPYSRTQDCNGARLELVDSHRDWGWHIVNHEKYREKARKAARDAERVADGSNAERMQKRKQVKDPLRPASTRAEPLSDSDSDSDSDSEKNSEKSRSAPLALPITPSDAKPSKPKRPPREKRTLSQIGERQLTGPMAAYALGKVPDIDAPATFEQFRDHHLKLATTFADWDAAWRTWIGNIVTKGFAYARISKPAVEYQPPERITREEWARRKAASRVQL